MSTEYLISGTIGSGKPHVKSECFGIAFIYMFFCRFWGAGDVFDRQRLKSTPQQLALSNCKTRYYWPTRQLQLSDHIVYVKSSRLRNTCFPLIWNLWEHLRHTALHEDACCLIVLLKLIWMGKMHKLGEFFSSLCLNLLQDQNFFNTCYIVCATLCGRHAFISFAELTIQILVEIIVQIFHDHTVQCIQWLYNFVSCWIELQKQLTSYLRRI